MRKMRPGLLLLLLAVAVALFCGTAWLAALAPTDTTHYECYSVTFWLGSDSTRLLPQGICSFLAISTPVPALHMLPQEYPPLTILLFSLPLLAPLPFYALTFALLMTIVAGLICWLLVNSGARGAAPLFVVYLLLGAATVTQLRFDLVPAGCTLLCLLAAERGRWRLAYGALAIGVLMKFYPIVMLPTLFLAEQRAWHAGLPEKQQPESWFLRTWKYVRHGNWWNIALFAGLLIIVMGSFALLNVNDAILQPLSYFVQRPLQVESLESSVIWLASFFGIPYQSVFSYGSFNLISSATAFIAPVGSMLSVAGLLWIYWLQWRQHIDPGQAFVGLVCVLIATGKVFSPQYLIWLIPLLVYLYASGRTSRAWMLVWAAICVLTTLVYAYYAGISDPRTAPQVLIEQPGFFEVVLLRNLCLLLAALAFVCGWWKARASNGRAAIPDA